MSDSREAHTKAVNEFKQRTKVFSQVADKIELHLIEKVEAIEVEILDDFIYQEDLPGLLTVVVFSLETGVFNVSKEELASWGKTPTELLQLARRQTEYVIQHDARYALEKLEDNTGLNYLRITSEHAGLRCIFNSAELENLTGKYGVFVSFPSYCVTLVVPIHHPEPAAELDIFNFINLTQDYFFKESAPISRYVYWYHDKQFKQLPWTTNQDNHLEVDFPKEWATVLSSS